MPASPSDSREQILLASAADVLRPLVALLVGRGVQYGTMADLVKAIFVEAAQAQVTGGGSARVISRLSVATGIHRKEVKRLLALAGATRPQAGESVASEVFARWLSDRRYLNAGGRPKVLPRLAAARGPSFESLARAVSNDVHPRTILEELLRLKLVELDADDRVTLLAAGFVPASEERHLMRLLADNVRDHLAAAVSNVSGEGPKFLEQAIFADSLSEATVREIDRIAREHWTHTFQQLVPQVQALIDAEDRAGRTGRHRARVGMYSFAQRLPEVTPRVTPAATPPPEGAPRRKPRKSG